MLSGLESIPGLYVLYIIVQSLDQVCILIKKSHEAKLLFAGTKKRLKS